MATAMLKIRQSHEAVVTLPVTTNQEQIQGRPIIQTEPAKQYATLTQLKRRVQSHGQVRWGIARNRVTKYRQQVLAQALKIRAAAFAQVHVRQVVQPLQKATLQAVQPPQKVILQEVRLLREVTHRGVHHLREAVVLAAVTVIQVVAVQVVAVRVEVHRQEVAEAARVEVHRQVVAEGNLC